MDEETAEFKNFYCMPPALQKSLHIITVHFHEMVSFQRKTESETENISIKARSVMVLKHLLPYLLNSLNSLIAIINQMVLENLLSVAVTEL